MTKSSQPTLILPPSAKFRRQQKSNGSYEMVEAYTKEEVLAILVSFMSWTKMEDGKPTVDGHLCAVLVPDSMYSEVWPARWNATCGNFDAAAGWFEADEVVAWMTLPTSDLLDKLESRDPPVPPVDTGTQGTPINTDLPPGQDITLPPPDMTIATEDPAGEVPAPKESTGSIAFDYFRQVMEAEENSLVERMCLAACITTEDAVAILEALKNPPESMVTAYLSANSAYWKEVDDGPSHPSKWRNGTPAEAVSVGWNAMIDVVLQSHRGEKS